MLNIHHVSIIARHIIFAGSCQKECETSVPNKRNKFICVSSIREKIEIKVVVGERKIFHLHVEFLQMPQRSRHRAANTKVDNRTKTQNKLNNLSGSMVAKGLYFNSLANFNDPSGMI